MSRTRSCTSSDALSEADGSIDEREEMAIDRIVGALDQEDIDLQLGEAHDQGSCPGCSFGSWVGVGQGAAEPRHPNGPKELSKIKHLYKGNHPGDV
jgi:hypothetical protein